MPPHTASAWGADRQSRLGTRPGGRSMIVFARSREDPALRVLATRRPKPGTELAEEPLVPRRNSNSLRQCCRIPAETLDGEIEGEPVGHAAHVAHGFGDGELTAGRELGRPRVGGEPFREVAEE